MFLYLCISISLLTLLKKMLILEKIIAINLAIVHARKNYSRNNLNIDRFAKINREMYFFASTKFDQIKVVFTSI